MKIDLSIQTIAAAIAALKIRAIEAESAKLKGDKFRSAHAEMQAAAYAMLKERLRDAPDDLLKLSSLQH